MSGLQGKVALVTGGARGQGASHVRRLAEAGAAVFITDVLDEEGAQLAAAIGGAVCYLHMDVSSEVAWQEVVSQIVEKHGRLDILVNNAGILQIASIVDTTAEIFERIMRINQLGTFLGIKSVTDIMSKQGGGSIINISSAFGLRGHALSIAYSSTKWAIRGMTKVAATELAPFKIRVNSVHPGIIDTKMLDEAPADQRAGLSEVPPFKRMGHPDEVAQLVLFLASDASGYISGAEVAIDGAWTA